MTPTYVEYSVSHGPGTLIEHGVMPLPAGVESDSCEAEMFCGHSKLLVQDYEIDADRYNYFITEHGSERAV